MDTIPAGTYVSVYLRRSTRKVIGGTLAADYTPGDRFVSINRPADIDWSGFGARPEGVTNHVIPASNIRKVG